MEAAKAQNWAVEPYEKKNLPFYACYMPHLPHPQDLTATTVLLGEQYTYEALYCTNFFGILLLPVT
jgi:hypothetical protein